MNIQDRDKMMDKIRKLIAKADSTDSSEESQAFMAAANRLLLKYNLTMSQVSVTDDSRNVTESDKVVEFGEVKEEGRWETLLMSVLCAHNMCDSILHKLPDTKKDGRKVYVNKGKISVIGKKDNVELVLYFFDMARSAMRRLSKTAYNAHRKDAKAQHPGHTDLELSKAKVLGYRMPWIRAYLKGAVFGLNTKLTSEKEAVIEDAPDMKSRYDIMIVTNRREVDEYIRDKYKNLKEASAAPVKTGDQRAFSQGNKAGRGMNLNKAVNSQVVDESKMLNA